MNVWNETGEFVAVAEASFSNNELIPFLAKCKEDGVFTLIFVDSDQQKQIGETIELSHIGNDINL